MSASSKKSVAQIVAAAIVNVRYYSKLRDDTKSLLGEKVVKENDSLRVTLNHTVTMANENVEQESGKILRRAMESIASSPESLETFAFGIFPTAKDEVSKLERQVRK